MKGNERNSALGGIPIELAENIERFYANDCTRTEGTKKKFEGHAP